MRRYYLKRESYSGCRGGVGDHEGGYELEIGSDLRASPEMVALCVMSDEIIEYMKNNNSHIGRLIYTEYLRTVETLERMLREDDD
jgi:hypothetical protein